MAFLLPKVSTSPPPHLPGTRRASQNAPPRAHHQKQQQLLLTKLDLSPLREVAQDKAALAAQDRQERERKERRDEFYLNVGMAVRTLREDTPSIFSKDLNYDIYRVQAKWTSFWFKTTKIEIGYKALVVTRNYTMESVQ